MKYIENTKELKMHNSLALPAKRLHLVAFFLLAFALSWSVWIPAALASRGLFPLQVSPMLTSVLGTFGPSLAALILLGVTAGKKGVTALLRRLWLWRVGLHWYAFVLLWPALLSLAASGLAVLFGSPAPDFAHPPLLRFASLPPQVNGIGLLVLLPVAFLQQFFLGSSMGEELGWRGYALPRLQARHSALLASIVLGLLWGLWHLPLFLTQGDERASIPFGWFLVSIVLAAIVYTWVYNHTQGSLLIALLFHTTTALTGSFLSSAATTPVFEVGVQLVAVSILVLVTGPTTLSRQHKLSLFPAHSPNS
jgi:membrane protease YdiL (CAAX protease family)